MGYSPHVITLNNRLSELSPSHQIVMINLINHLASMPDEYKADVMERLFKLSVENPFLTEDKYLGVAPIPDEVLKQTETSIELLERIADEQDEKMREHMEENAPAFGD